jgi:hypothetical protein
MHASEVIQLVESSGIGALSRTYAISRRQAEQFEIQARRVRALGADPLMVPGDTVGTVRAAQRPQEPLQAPTPDPEQDAQARARRIRELRDGHRVAAEGELAASIGQLVLQR